MTARPRSTQDDVRLDVSHAAQAAAIEEAKRRAVRVVAGRSDGAADCRELLGMLGLDRTAGLPPLVPGLDDPGIAEVGADDAEPAADRPAASAPVDLEAVRPAAP